jgi:hypothetical protein
VADGKGESDDDRSVRHLPVLGQGDVPVRQDLDDGLRFLHTLNMQVKFDVFDARTKLGALIEALVAEGHIDPLALEERRKRIQAREARRQAEKVHVQISDVFDKYAMDGLPEIPCAELIPLCGARCCTLALTLSFQDLDEGKVEWDYGLPYVVKKRPDGLCVHNDASTHACTVYEHRPASCRRYDCRADARIWLDFEKRIPAP